MIWFFIFFFSIFMNRSIHRQSYLVSYPKQYLAVSRNIVVACVSSFSVNNKGLLLYSAAWHECGRTAAWMQSCTHLRNNLHHIFSVLWSNPIQTYQSQPSDHVDNSDSRLSLLCNANCYVLCVSYVDRGEEYRWKVAKKKTRKEKSVFILFSCEFNSSISIIYQSQHL